MTSDFTKTDPVDSVTEKQVLATLGIGLARSEDGSDLSVADLATLAVIKTFGQAYKEGHVRRGAEAAFKVATQYFDHEPHVTMIGVGGREAVLSIERALTALIDDGQRRFGIRHPAYEWLWMIRRLPFPGDDHAMATWQRLWMTTLALATNSRHVRHAQGGFIDVTPRHGRSLAFLTGYAGVTTSLARAYRIVGKEGLVTLNFDKQEVSYHTSEALGRRLEDYDRRVASEHSWGGLGIFLPALFDRTSPAADPAPNTIGLVALFGTPTLIDTERPPGKLLARYVEWFADLDDAFRFLSDGEAPDPQHLNPELRLLVPLLAAYRALAAGGPFDRSTQQMVGYGLYTSDAEVGADMEYLNDTPLGQAVAEGLAWTKPRLSRLTLPSSAAELLRNVSTLEWSAWNAQPGPIIVPVTRTTLVIDWYAATMRLVAALRYPVGDGATANLRGRTFEKSVRSAIGTTVWGPVPWLADLVGKTLRLNHRAIGDVDAAISLPNDLHLIVSCKSYPYSVAYERGDHAAVRNVASKLQEDVTTALEFARILSHSRIGDNYTIPPVAVLIPLVVTPRVMFTDDPVLATPLIPGLPPVVAGFGELMQFLSRLAPT